MQHQCHSFQRQPDPPSALAIGSFCVADASEVDVDITDQKRQSDQDQAEGWISGGGACSCLMHLSIACFHSKPTPIQVEDLMVGDVIHAPSGIGEPFDAVPAIPPLVVSTDEDHIGGIGVVLARVEGVDTAVAFPSYKQGSDASRFAFSGNRDQVRNSAPAQQKEHLLAAKAFIQIGSTDTDAQPTCLCNKALHDLAH